MPLSSVPASVIRVLGAPGRWSVAAQTFALQVLIAVLVVGAGLVGAYGQAQRAGDEQAMARALAVARTVAATPSVVTAVEGPGPSAIRYTHPDPGQIGRTFIGHTEEALAGGVVEEDYTGTLGPSSRVVVPVTDAGKVVAMVAVGIHKSAIGERVRAQLPVLLLAGLVAALLSGLGTGLVSRRIRRQTHGLGEQQLREMYEYYDAVLHAVTEGLVITDLDGHLRLANDEATRLLALPADAVGRPVAELGLTPALTAALTDDAAHEDELHVTSARVLVLNRGPARWKGRLLGHVATLRDRTDLEALTGELDSARGLTEALRSQAHESANRLHTIVSLIELRHTDRALDFATDELQVSQVLTDRVVGSVDEPALTVVLLGKAAEAHERGIAFEIEPGSRWPQGVAPTRDVVTIVGNLIDNALDAVAGDHGRPGASRPERHVRFDARVEGAYAVLQVSDDGPGLPPGAVEDAFRRGWSTKAQGSAGRRGIGLALVAQTVERLGGDLEVTGPPGATFTVRLPVGPVSPVGSGTAGSADE